MDEIHDYQNLVGNILSHSLTHSLNIHDDGDSVLGCDDISTNWLSEVLAGYGWVFARNYD